MTTVSGPEQKIVLVDLRETDPAGLTSRRFAQIQAERAPGGDPRRVDFRRVIILDDTSTLARNHELYSHILDSHVDISVVCLAVGPGSDDDATVAVRRPFQLGPPKAATLWIGDVNGIGWQMDSTQADIVHLPVEGEQGSAVATPWTLTEILSLPQIFDRVVETVSQMPGAAACPGTRVVRSETDPDVLADAQAMAVRRLTDATDATTAAVADSELSGLGRPAAPRNGDVPPQVRDTEVIQPADEVDQRYQRCRRAAREVSTNLQRLRGPGWLLRGDGRAVRASFAQLADSLTDFTVLVDRTLGWADPRSGFDSGQLDQLGRLGIKVPWRPVRPAPVIDALRELAIGALDQQQTLPRVAELLRNRSDQAVPQGTSSYRERLSTICPSTAMRRLQHPPALLTGARAPWLLIVTFAVSLLAGLWPVPVAVAGAAAVLVLAGMVMLISARATAITGPGGRATKRFTLSQLAASVIGAGAGVALSREVALPVPDTVTSMALGIGIGIVLVTAVAVLWWLSIVGRWTSGLRLATLLRAAESIRGLIIDVASREWQWAQEQSAISDYARILAGAVEDLGAGLQAHAARRPGPAWQSRGATAGPARNHQVVYDLVFIDMRDAVADTLRRLCVLLSSGGLVPLDGATVLRELTVSLSSYDAHLASVGLQEPPPFGRASDRRPLLVKSLMERATDLQTLMRADVRDENIVQLCAPEQLALLETDPAAAAFIRFAPQAAQESITVRLPPRSGRAAWDRPVDWTVASSMAGLLRLVPLRPHAVQEVWAASEVSQKAGQASPPSPGVHGPDPREPFPDLPSGHNRTNVTAGNDRQPPAAGQAPAIDQGGAAGE